MTLESVDDVWDVVVIGSGMGGATVALELAQAGFKVLVLERGKRVSSPTTLADGRLDGAPMDQGWWPEPITLIQDGKSARVQAPLGCAVGGSTVHYAAALERFERSDLEPLVTEHGESVSWPLGFDELVPYYQRAEALFGLREDYAREAWPRLSEWDQTLVSVMRRNGLQPELMRVAIRYDKDCRECIGVVCDRKCKADAGSACIDKALALPGFQLQTECEVLKLEADGNAVKSVLARSGGATRRYRGRVIILAAGALHSPQILLRSSSTDWPTGLANRSGLVGRNLMFHSVDVFALWGPRKLSRQGAQKKSLSIRDFYVTNGERLGYAQSMGLDADRGVLSAYIKDSLARLGVRSRLAQKVIAKVFSRFGELVVGRARLFAGMTEDDPWSQNRIELAPDEPDGAVIHYTTTEGLRHRSAKLHDAFASGIRPWRLTRISAGLQMNLGHSCGTCRFGSDPARSVLDVDCRAHGIDNLYVVDSSFMPRSGAVNPSLTIAANALRVAPRIAEYLRTGQR